MYTGIKNIPSKRKRGLFAMLLPDGFEFASLKECMHCGREGGGTHMYMYMYIMTFYM